jgi:hypothetical protein
MNEELYSAVEAFPERFNLCDYYLDKGKEIAYFMKIYTE